MSFVSSLMFWHLHCLLIRKCKKCRQGKRGWWQENQWVLYRSHSIVVKEICRFAETTSAGCELARLPTPRGGECPSISPPTYLPLARAAPEPCGVRREEKAQLYSWACCQCVGWPWAIISLKEIRWCLFLLPKCCAAQLVNACTVLWISPTVEQAAVTINTLLITENHTVCYAGAEENLTLCDLFKSCCIYFTVYLDTSKGLTRQPG